MEKKQPAPVSIDDYIARCPRDLQPRLQELRRVILAAAPGAEERISYGMPGFYLHGMLVWFGAHPHHIGFYPTGAGIEAFKEELSPYKTSKGAVQFPLDQPIPYELVRRIVQFRLAQNMSKQGA